MVRIVNNEILFFFPKVFKKEGREGARGKREGGKETLAAKHTT